MTDLKKRLFAGLLALVLLCAPLSGCAAREAERYDVLASTAPVRAMTAALLEGVMLRIRAERNVTWGRAAILKAYYLNNPHTDCPKEVLTVSLNEASTNPAYTLGRLFSVYEAVQQAANPGINATIKDKYFSSACATPAVVFPTLVKLAQKHLQKLAPGSKIFYNQQLTDLMAKLSQPYPARMTLPEQGAFEIGYYHQTQKRYEKKDKEDESNGSN